MNCQHCKRSFDGWNEYNKKQHQGSCLDVPIVDKTQSIKNWFSPSSARSSSTISTPNRSRKSSTSTPNRSRDSSSTSTPNRSLYPLHLTPSPLPSLSVLDLNKEPSQDDEEPKNLDKEPSQDDESHLTHLSSSESHSTMRDVCQNISKNSVCTECFA